MDSYSFKTKITLNDYRAFNFQHSFDSNSKWTIWMIRLIVILYPILLLTYFLGRDQISFIAVVLSTICLLAALFISLVLYFYSRTIFNDDKYLQEEQIYHVDTREIKVVSESASLVCKWDDLHRSIETKKYFFIYITKLKALIIPKGQLLSEQKEFLSKKVAENKV